MRNIIITHQDMFGTLWAIGWLFTIGYFRFPFKKGFFALFIWPYYLGERFSKEPKEKEQESK